MKKTVLILWNILAIVVLVCIVYFFYYSKNRGVKIKNPFADMELHSSVFNSDVLDSLLLDYPCAFALLGLDSCNMCKIVYTKLERDYPSVGKAYFDLTFHENNLLISQALLQTGFPMLVVIDRGRNLRAICNNYDAVKYKIDSIIVSHNNAGEIYIDYMPKIKMNRKNFTKAIDASFKSSLAYMDEDYEAMKDYAYESLNRWSYFYNNYLLNRYYAINLMSDSVAHYKQQALSFSRTEAIQAVVYKDKIEKLKL